jgi:hypothetical protein
MRPVRAAVRRGAGDMRQVRRKERSGGTAASRIDAQ